MITRNTLRVASVLAVLVAGSCASPPEDKPTLFEDGATNHPITVEPVYRALKLPASAMLSNGDAADLTVFVDDYLARGNGAISISVPAGADATPTIDALGERLVTLGVPRSRILVGVQDQTASDGRVEVGYVTFQAHTDACGNWSVNAGDTADNVPMPNYGCSVQHNIAAELADPRDLDQPRGMGDGDTIRRMQVLNKYEQAQTTSAQKTQDQSAAISDVGAAQ